MLQCLVLVVARYRRRISLGTHLLRRSTGFPIRGTNISIGQEGKPGIETRRDSRRGQKLAIFHPSGTLLPPDARI